MGLVAIQEQNLINIGNSLRETLGGTKIVQGYRDFYVSKTSNASHFDCYDINTIPSNQEKDTFTVAGATKLVVKIAFWLKHTTGIYVNNNEKYHYTDYEGYQYDEFEIEGDTVSINPIRMWLNGGFYYAEVRGYDADGNIIAEDTISDIEVFNDFLPSEMSDGIKNVALMSIQKDKLHITNDCRYRFAYGCWDWFIEQFGKMITTSDIASIENMFTYSSIKEVPFDINMQTDKATLQYAFANCGSIRILPNIKLNLVNPSASNINFGNIFANCYNMKNLDDMFDADSLDILSSIKITSAYSSPKYNDVLNRCYSLRRLPPWFYKLRISEDSTSYPSQSYTIYQNAFIYCYALDEITNIPVLAVTNAAQTAGMFSNTFHCCARAKECTFETNEDGTPKVVKWKTQVINLSSDFGSLPSSSRYSILSYNSGITADKEVTDDATYQALKNDPDWWTCNVAYSRYNHDSAVNTINSLPDTSAYLASAGGTNTIKFKGASGSATDGGAINTLTEEEIAVATAKGWTVSFA